MSSAEFEWLWLWLPALVLHMVRVSAFLHIVPIFGADSSSHTFKFVLALSLGALMWWVDPNQVTMPQHPLELGVMLFREVLIGLVCGFAVRSIVFMLSVAGEVIAQEMGFSMSRIMDPSTGTDSTVMSQLFETMGILLIFELNLHHEILRVLQNSYALVPVGQPFDYAIVYERLANIITRSIELGLQYAIPIFGVMILLTVVLVVLSRAVPNINLMEFSFGLRILLAFSASIYFLIEGAPFLGRVFEQLLLDSHDLLVQH